LDQSQVEVVVELPYPPHGSNIGINILRNINLITLKYDDLVRSYALHGVHYNPITIETPGIMCVGDFLPEIEDNVADYMADLKESRQPSQIYTRAVAAYDSDVEEDEDTNEDDTDEDDEDEVAAAVKRADAMYQRKLAKWTEKWEKEWPLRITMMREQFSDSGDLSHGEESHAKPRRTITLI